MQSSNRQSLLAGLEALDENEAAVLETRQDLRAQLAALSLKDSGRLTLLDKELQCTKVLEKIGFTRRQFKRRLKALKAGKSVPALDGPIDFSCD